MQKILIVDDEPNILLTLEYTFKKAGYEVFIARDGNEALEILQNHVPSLVILDIMMPKVDGFEVLEYIKREANLVQTKVLFLSAKNKEQDIQKGLEAGADAYLTKPFSIKKLSEQVEMLLQYKFILYGLLFCISTKYSSTKNFLEATSYGTGLVPIS